MMSGDESVPLTSAAFVVALMRISQHNFIDVVFVYILYICFCQIKLLKFV